MKKELTCKGCQKRYPGCHSKCETYLEWKKEHDELKRTEKKNKWLESLNLNKK